MPKTPPQNEEDFDDAVMYPQLTPSQRQEAIKNLERYLSVVKRIFQSVEAEKSTADFDAES